MLELKERKLQVKFKDVVYDLTYPSVKMAAEYEDKFKKKEKNDQFIMIEYFVQLGLTKDVAESLEDYQYQLIMDELRKPLKG